MGRTSDARDRLLDSARVLIHERGYHAVGIAELCAAAGVHKGSFYHFFPSKQQLVLELIDAYWRDTREELEVLLEGRGDGATPLERLGAYLDEVAATQRGVCDARGSQPGCPLANLALEMSVHDPTLRDRLLQAFEAQIGYFERLLRRARAEGELDPAAWSDDALHRAAASMLALLEGRLMLSKLHQDAAPLDELRPAVEQLLGVPLGALRTARSPMSSSASSSTP